MCAGSQTCQVVLRLLAQEEIPIVADASALNELSRTPDLARDLRAPTVLTPHPGEAARLMKALSIAGEPGGDDEQRIDACVRLAQRTGSVVALKGHRTVVSDGQRFWICARGHPALGVGGTGDVLAGAIGSIIAQTRKEDRFDLLTATALAVEAHAIAGERWAEQSGSSGGMVATELADALMGVLEELREGPES